ncbi:MAG: ABC transporter substrate-binding protein, partial [Candidatus Limnocylindria bacterium]
MRTWRWFTVLAVLGLVLAACQAGASPSAEESAPAESEPAATEGPAFEGMSYPEDGPAECGT